MSFAEIRRELQSRAGMLYIGFDLGGTLYDRLPLHETAILSLLRVGPLSSQGIEVRRSVQESVLKGLGSFEMFGDAYRVAFGNSLMDAELAEFVLKKRALVDSLQARSTIAPALCLELVKFSSIGEVAVLSRGQVEESRDLLDRSFRALSQSMPAIAVYGRSGAIESTDKNAMIDVWLEGAASIEQCCYIGDSDADADACARAGIAFFRVDTFSQSLPR